MKGLTEYEKFLLLRPLPSDWPKDEKGIPFLKKNNFEDVNWDGIKFTSLSNIGSTKDKGKKIVLNYQFDKSLLKLWNNPIKYLIKLVPFFAVASPDFSAYSNMDLCQIEENVRHSLWLAAWYQYYGINVIPTITWADEKSYHICFDYVAYGSVVTISTVGINNIDLFIKGFAEMIKRINPPLIIVRGKPIVGMVGNFIFIDFDETFEKEEKYEQIKLLTISKIQTLRKAEK